MLSSDPDQEPARKMGALGRGLGGRPIRRAGGGAKLKMKDEGGQLTQ